VGGTLRNTLGNTLRDTLQHTLGNTLESTKIGKYYATQDMVGPKCGKDTLRDYYAQLVKQHCQQTHHQGQKEKDNAGALLQEEWGGGKKKGALPFSSSSSSSSPSPLSSLARATNSPLRKMDSEMDLKMDLGMPPTSVLLAQVTSVFRALTELRDKAEKWRLPSNYSKKAPLLLVVASLSFPLVFALALMYQ
jgi:hypothetical protein